MCTVDGCNNKHHSKGYCRKHYRIKNVKFCGVSGCTNIHYARNYCSRHYRIHCRDKTCKVKGCEVAVNTKGYCTKHYHRYRKYSDTSMVKSKKVIGICKHKGCKRDIDTGGYCTKHYQRFLKHGTSSAEPLNRDMEHDGKCSVEGCDGVFFAKKLCKAHYNRQSKKIFLSTERGREMNRFYCQKRRAMKKNAPINDYTVKQWKDCLDHFNNECAYCGKKKEVLDQEHVIPISRGGSNTKTNIIPSCGSCNYTKGTRTLFEWYHTSEKFCERRNEKILKYLGYKLEDKKIQLQLF